MASNSEAVSGDAAKDKNIGDGNKEWLDIWNDRRMGELTRGFVDVYYADEVEEWCCIFDSFAVNLPWSFIWLMFGFVRSKSIQANRLNIK